MSILDELRQAIKTIEPIAAEIKENEKQITDLLRKNGIKVIRFVGSEIIIEDEVPGSVEKLTKELKLK